MKRPTLPARLASEVTRGSPVVQPVFINRVSAFLPFEAVDNERKKLTVSVKIFGRKTPMELSFTQVEKE